MSLIIQFDPADYDMNIIKARFSSISSYYIDTHFEFSGAEILQSLYYEDIPPDILEVVEKRLRLSDLKYEIICEV